MQQGSDETTIRTIIFTTLLFSNIFLTLVNRSFVYSVFKTLRYKNNLVPLIAGITLLFIALLLYVPFVQNLFRLNTLPLATVGICAGIALAGTLWIDLWKWLKTKKADSIN